MTSSTRSAVLPVSGARTVPFLNFPAQFEEEREDLTAAVMRVFERGDFVGGADIEAFEHEVAAYAGAAHAVALNSGTDALVYGLSALGLGAGDEVITPSNSFVASTAAIAHVGAKPVFADVLDDQMLDPAAVRAAITPRTKAIMPVHLTGRVAAMGELRELARSHHLAIIEDSAQAFASKLDGKFAGLLGDVGAFSAHPLKNLNAAGDAGFVLTQDAAVAERIRGLRNHGFRDRDTALRFGFVSRMDTLQAAVLRVRLPRVAGVVARRRANAARYDALLDRANVFVPSDSPQMFNTYHLYVVQVERRDELQASLSARGIATKVHYPLPIHLQPAAAHLGYARGSLPVTERQADRILSIPINQFLAPDDIAYVAAAINEFYA
jgi:dTDP-4-amino-4,6-dideoxygalactose transaminase